MNAMSSTIMTHFEFIFKLGYPSFVVIAPTSLRLYIELYVCQTSLCFLNIKTMCFIKID